MSSASETMENASIISDTGAHDGNRLWIGNIDPKITEYHLVKLLEKFGHVKQFDFLFHKSGPLEGQPRGYCFVNFNTREEAERAIHCLNGKLALSKKLVVRWAHAQVMRSQCWLSEMFGLNPDGNLLESLNIGTLLPLHVLPLCLLIAKLTPSFIIFIIICRGSKASVTTRRCLPAWNRRAAATEPTEP
nr:probable RNA-binding protein 18 isoform X2 [Syngnathus scovelli]